MELRINQLITFLFTNNLTETVDFYVNRLGLKVVLDQGSCQIIRVSESAYLGFCLTDAAIETGHVIITIVCSKVDEWYAYLTLKGVEVEKPPVSNQKYQIYHLFLRDPNGYLIEIQEFLDPNWNSDETEGYEGNL